MGNFAMGYFVITSFSAVTLGSVLVKDVPGLRHLIAQTYLWKVAEEFQSTSSGSEMAAKRSAWE